MGQCPCKLTYKRPNLELTPDTVQLQDSKMADKEPPSSDNPKGPSIVNLHKAQSDPGEGAGRGSNLNMDDEGVTFEVVEEEAEGGRKVPRKGVYLLPNLFTTGALFSGFYAIVAAMNGMFEQAAVAIFVAMVLDGFDGRVARMTNTESEFGAQYDSLSDCISFGVAPALVAYAWSLSNLGKVGWMIAFVYAACAALRLARFNVQIESTDKRYFAGLPSPAAAAVVAGMGWVGNEQQIDPSDNFLAALAAAVTAFCAVMMVSNIKYNSFKEIDIKGRVPFVAILLAVLVLAVISVHPEGMLLAIFSLYALSGPVLRLIRGKSKSLG